MNIWNCNQWVDKEIWAIFYLETFALFLRALPVFYLAMGVSTGPRPDSRPHSRPASWTPTSLTFVQSNFRENSRRREFATLIGRFCVATCAQRAQSRRHSLLRRQRRRTPASRSRDQWTNHHRVALIFWGGTLWTNILRYANHPWKFRRGVFKEQSRCVLSNSIFLSYFDGGEHFIMTGFIEVQLKLQEISNAKFL